MLNQVDVSFENVRELLDMSQHKLVVFAFWSERSEPSKQLLQTLSAISQDHPQHLVLAKVNCDLDQELAMQFGVRSLPTTMLIQHGQPVDGFAGVAVPGAGDQHLGRDLAETVDDALGAEVW